MEPIISKIYVAFNGMPMQECNTLDDARVLRKSILQRQKELQDGDFSEDMLTILELKIYQLEN